MYDFKHQCDEMPQDIDFCKLKGSVTSQFSSKKYVPDMGYFQTTLYGFKYCPYCGEKLSD